MASCERLPLDVMFLITEYLDVVSLSRFSQISRTIFNEIYTSKAFWERLLARQCAEFCIPISSFPHSSPYAAIGSVHDVRRLATRSQRLKHAIISQLDSEKDSKPDNRSRFPKTPSLPLRSVHSLNLGFGQNVNGTPQKMWRPIFRLVPGGRWVIGIADLEEPPEKDSRAAPCSVHVLCWELPLLYQYGEDVDAGRRRNPVASIKSSVRVERHQFRTFDMQWDKLDQRVNVLLTYTASGQPNDICELIQLHLPQRPNASYTTLSAPSFQRRAVVPRLETSVMSVFTRLQGSYAVIQSRHLAYVWDWRNGTRGIIADHGHVGKTQPVILGDYALVPKEERHSHTFHAVQIDEMPHVAPPSQHRSDPSATPIETFQPLEPAHMTYLKDVSILPDYTYSPRMGVRRGSGHANDHAVRRGEMPRFGADFRPVSLWMTPPSPSASGSTKTSSNGSTLIMWRTVGMPTHIVRYAPPSTVTLLGTNVDSVGRALVDWVPVSSSSIFSSSSSSYHQDGSRKSEVDAWLEIPRLHGEWLEGLDVESVFSATFIVHSRRPISRSPSPTSSFSMSSLGHALEESEEEVTFHPIQLSFPRNVHNPIVGSCATSGVFFCAPTLEREYSPRSEVMCEIGIWD